MINGRRIFMVKDADSLHPPNVQSVSLDQLRKTRNTL